jgi:hypothetical protein
MSVTKDNNGFLLLSASCPTNSSITHDQINNIWSAPEGWTVSQIQNNIPYDIIPPDAKLSRNFVPYMDPDDRSQKSHVDITCSYSLDKNNALVLKKSYSQNNDKNSLWGPIRIINCWNPEGVPNDLITKGFGGRICWKLGVNIAIPKEHLIATSWHYHQYSDSSTCITTASMPEICSWNFYAWFGS